MLRAAVAVPVLIALAASSAAAQTQDAPPRTSLLKSGFLGAGYEVGYSMKDLLLQREPVQKELKLTDDQLARLKKTQAEVDQYALRRRQEQASLLKALRAQGDRQAYEAALQERQQKSRAHLLLLTSEEDGPLMKVLDRRQRTRLEQVQIQLEGPMAFTRPQVQERLNLSPDQIEAIGAIIEEGRAAIARAAEIPAGVLPAGQLTPEVRRTMLESKTAKAEIDKGREAVLKARRSTMQMIAKILTRKQRERYEAMLGEPFDMQKLQSYPPPADSGARPTETKAP
jgi:hypothetical protein